MSRGLAGLMIDRVILAVALLPLAGCGQAEQMWSHVKSDTVKLDRRITLYAADGSVIREWRGRYNVEVQGTSARFIDDTRAVHISGTFVIEELTGTRSGAAPGKARSADEEAAERFLREYNKRQKQQREE